MESLVNTASTKTAEKRRAGGAPEGNQNAVRHGTYSRVAALKGGGLDKRTRAYKLVAARTREYTKALADTISPQKRFLAYDAAVTEMLLLAPLDTHLASLKHMVRKGRPVPALEIRLKLAEHVRSNLQAMGLDKIKRQPTPFWQRQPRRRKNQGDGGEPSSDKESEGA